MLKTIKASLLVGLFLIPCLSFSEEIVLTFAGDTTLGEDPRFYGKTFSWQWDQTKNYNYFTLGVKHIFEQDDLTIVNLEGTLTVFDKPEEKKFKFKGDPHYVNILKQGSIEAVNLANNHIFDFGQQGRNDTIDTLNEAGIKHFGNPHAAFLEVKNKYMCFSGYAGWQRNVKDSIKSDIATMKKFGCDRIIISFHWGQERKYHSNEGQQELGRYAIDEGADLVVGHHPHVIQEIEYYKCKPIVYSLGNFIFGGNRNPTDKKAILYQISFNEDGYTDKVIPIRISSVKHRNNYQPIEE